MEPVHRFLSFERRFPEAADCAETSVVYEKREAVIEADFLGEGGEIVFDGEVRLKDFDLRLRSC